MISGFLVIDKPAGITSADVVYRVKKKLPKGTRVGHAGTLDPNVTGVLPLAIGTATKAFAFLDDAVKSYRVSMTLGFTTDTEDIWGRVVQSAPVPKLSEQTIKTKIEAFIGDYWQVPPMYSARKIEGEKLYEKARRGEVVAREAVKRHIHGIEVDHVSNGGDGALELDGTIEFTVTCSRGTYIRTLCTDIGKALGTLGTMTALRRIKTDCFVEAHAVALEVLEGASLEDLVALMQPIQVMFEGMPRIQVDAKHAVHLRNGVKVNLERFSKAKGLHYWSVWTQGPPLQFIGVAKTEPNGIFFKQWLGD